MKTIKEIADMFEVSTVALYKRINTDNPSGLKDTVLIDNGVKKMNATGVSMLEQVFRVNVGSSDADMVNSNDLLVKENEMLKGQVESLENTIRILESQLYVKDEQITKLTQMNDQGQKLLAMEQQKTLMLESKENKKSIWEKIFGDKKE